jgi:hypothetical protein
MKTKTLHASIDLYIWTNLNLIMQLASTCMDATLVCVHHIISAEILSLYIYMLINQAKQPFQMRLYLVPGVKFWDITYRVSRGGIT